MADVSNIRTDWQNVSHQDWLENNTKAQANNISGAEMNTIGNAIISINNDNSGFGQSISALESGLSAADIRITNMRSDLDDALFEFASVDYSDLPTGIVLTLWYDAGWPTRPTSRPGLPVQWCSVGYQGIPPTAIPGVDFIKVMEYQSIPDPDPDPDPVPDGTVLALTTLSDQVDGFPIGDSGVFTARNPGTNSLMARTTSAHSGPMGMEINGDAQSRILVFEEVEAEANTRVIDFDFRIRNIVGNSYIASMLDYVNGGTRCDLRINGDRSVTVRSGGVATGASAEDIFLQTLTWYRLEWHISPIGQRVRVYDYNNTEYVMDFLGTITNAMGNGYAFGAPVAQPAGTLIDMDTLRVGDGWLPAYVA